MRVLRVVGKVFLFPVMVIGIIIQWIGILIVGVSSIILRYVAGIILLIAGVSFFLGIVSGMDAIKIGGIAIAVLILSIIGKGGLVLITAINEIIRDHFFA